MKKKKETQIWGVRGTTKKEETQILGFCVSRKETQIIGFLETKEERKKDSSCYAGREEEDKKENQQSQFEIQVSKFEIEFSKENRKAKSQEERQVRGFEEMKKTDNRETPTRLQ